MGVATLTHKYKIQLSICSSDGINISIDNFYKVVIHIVFYLLDFSYFNVFFQANDSQN